MKLKSLIENNEFKVKKLQKIVEQVEALKDDYASLTDEELQNQTNEFKKALKSGNTLEDILPHAFAAIREADKRVLGLFPYPVQIMGGIVLNQGNLAEMKTGEGKTLTETMPVYLNALTGKGVHVVTVNEYLSERDYTEMKPVYEFMKLTVGLNGNNKSAIEKKAAYACDITYSTNSELGFDYLRDNMALYKEIEVQRGLNYCIIDEADSILIDEARTPLIIAGKAESQIPLYKRADSFAKSLSKNEYTYDKETKTVSLLPNGAKRAAQWFGVTNIYDSASFNEAHYIDEALKANYAMKKDHDYVVQLDESGEMTVDIVDQNTGRVMKGRRYSDGLHQAIEAKENVRIKAADRTEADITYQNFFRMYTKVAGMSGTAATEEGEFYETYHMEVIQVPTNKPVARQDLSDIIYPTKRAKYKAVLDKIMEVHSSGRPILVGTISVESSELISNMLDKHEIPHTVLNAKNNSKEAQIIAQAGQQGAITIATNMAGRGTDIKLGLHVRELGGLFVLGTEKHESRRIDNQLRGRSGRQGDPGTSQFYISLEDDLIIRFGDPRTQKYKERCINAGEEYELIESKIVRRYVEKTQRRVEGNSYDERKNTLRYDDVLRDQRNAIYKERQEIMNFNGDFTPYLVAMFARTINMNVDLYCPLTVEHIAGRRVVTGEHNENNDWNYDGLFQFAQRIFGFDFLDNSNQSFINNVMGYELHENSFESMKRIEIKYVLFKLAKAKYEQRIHELVNPQDISLFERVVILRAVDECWKTNISNMEQLRMSVTLRGYGQYNPLVEYQKTSFQMYEEMLSEIEEKITQNYMKASIVDE
jgi:preprotein translocase subunit SecA